MPPPLSIYAMNILICKFAYIHTTHKNLVVKSTIYLHLRHVSLLQQLHIVSREQPGLSVAHALVPPVVVLLYDVDDRFSTEGELILLVFGIVVHSLHCKNKASLANTVKLLRTKGVSRGWGRWGRGALNVIYTIEN